MKIKIFHFFDGGGEIIKKLRSQNKKGKTLNLSKKIFITVEKADRILLLLFVLFLK